MKKTKIITDSCADIGSDLLEKYGIDYARMTVIEDKEESPALLTWSKEDAHKLYDTIRGGKRILTSQASSEEFNRIFTECLELDYDIVYIGCSSKQSGSVNTARVVSQKLLKKYTEAEIFCIDSLNASLGEGMLAVEAAKLAENGMRAEEISEKIIAIRKNVNQFATVHTLEHLKRAGRVTASSAFFGNLMGVKPILISDINGTQCAVKKVKGRRKSFDEIVKCLSECIREAEVQTVYIAHSDCTQDEVELLTSLVKEKIPCKDIYTGIIGPIIGASIGPDAVAVWGFGDAVTYETEEE